MQKIPFIILKDKIIFKKPINKLRTEKNMCMKRQKFFNKKRRLFDPYKLDIYNENKSYIFHILIVVELQNRTNSLGHLLTIYSNLLNSLIINMFKTDVHKKNFDKNSNSRREQYTQGPSNKQKIKVNKSAF